MCAGVKSYTIAHEFNHIGYSLIHWMRKQKKNKKKTRFRLSFCAHQRGTNAPLAMKAIFNLLALMDNQEIVRVVREWKEGTGKTKYDNSESGTGQHFTTEKRK